MRLVSVAFATASFTFALMFGACTAEDGKDFEDVPDEPALDSQEQQQLPTGLRGGARRGSRRCARPRGSRE